ncbi:Glycerol-3-phosphate regulon repressor [Rosistilla carotiformis]|uniref:Glycerol-3-phosphate regulon repressor n=1 Tax=Rosistilla carotiformis TaxID=2528017 RepID=A0A518JTM7_9BACT|nr:DeoR/GlpR family DNA-binding transcription regulator [Rosistilla carotiformis]QDV68904.1 Glycerol-3-phosphate regulon repressor [Rosistilla carotiformis]
MKVHRHEEIMKVLAETGTLSVEEAVARFGASVATVRRDFGEMADANLVRRVRGGVQVLHNDQTMPIAIREVRQRNAKLAIAREAVTMLAPGNVVFVDGGTTTLQMGNCLPAIPLRLITNSLRLAAAIESHSSSRAMHELFLTGGFLFPGTGLLVGPSAQASIAQYHAQWTLLSVSGINLSGLYNDNEHVVESERLMIAHADRVIVLADHTKIGKHSMCHIAGLNEIDVIVTNRHPDTAEALEAFENAGVEVLFAAE